MSDTKKLNLILCWHMHQPDYRNYASGEFELPWTYLHAIKDYADMASHLEKHPAAKAVFNFVPILLDQLEDYSDQFASGQMRDPLLRLLQIEDMASISVEERNRIFYCCFACNHQMMIQPYPPFKRLQDIYKKLMDYGEAALIYLSGQYLSDLIVWYHLVWMGETVRRQHELLIRLMSKGEGFTREDRLALFHLIGRVIGDLIPRYRKLAEEGRIELSTTPHYHPIGPLLIDFHSARDSEPSAPLPESMVYPGGLRRATFHITSALKSHEARFGMKPAGFWPAEGGVSDAFLKLLGEQGCKWTATGEGVLANSLRKQHGGHFMDKSASLYRPYRIDDIGVDCFFRDDALSDKIGFEYAKWHGKDAVENFVQALEDIWHRTAEDEDPVVSVILDGENAWEYYSYNGYYFLTELYARLQEHAFIRLTTFSEYLNEKPSERRAKTGELAGLVAGSWVYGSFSTWIGSHDKNRAWDLLCAAKGSFDLVIGSGRLSEDEKAAATKQLASCESSDWFWWFGDYNPSQSVASFDRLFRLNLSSLYQVLKLPVPAILSEPISRGGNIAVDAGGAMRRAS
jgi:alpha-amylase/alpha-mannosidase (GH57 family)